MPAIPDKKYFSIKEVSELCEQALKFLQAMCEGHCHYMQNIVRTQAGVNQGTVFDVIGRSLMLVALMAEDEDVLKKLDDDELTLLKAALDFLTEVSDLISAPA